MSICSHDQMINHHDGVFSQFSEMLHIWRDRKRQRRELSLWTERDLHDVGLSWSEVVHEAEKPFWRA